MDDLSDKQRRFKERLEKLAKHRTVVHDATTEIPAVQMDEFTSRILEWEARLDQRLSIYHSTRETGTPVAVSRPRQLTDHRPLVSLAEDPLFGGFNPVEAMMFDELGLGKYPIPNGFRTPLRVLENHGAMQTAIHRFCGLENRGDLYPGNGSRLRAVHLPGQGTLVNRSYFNENGMNSSIPGPKRENLVAAEIARERWGWGFLVEYTSLGKSAGEAGLWPGLVADRMGLSDQNATNANLARSLRQSWMLTEAGWEDWIWQYVMFKSRHPVGEGLLHELRPGRMFELIGKVLNLFPLFVYPIGFPIRLRNLLDLFNYLFLQQGEIIPHTLNSVLRLTQRYCSKHDKAIEQYLGMPLSKLLGRFYFAQLEANVGILATPYALLVACHDEWLDLKKITDARALLTQIKKDPRSNTDTRLALLSRLDPTVKYDPKAMAAAAWERLRLEGPREYFQ